MSKQSSDLFAEIQETAQSLFETQKWDEAVYSTQVALDNARDLLDGSQTSLKHLINCLELHSRSLRMKGESEESRQEIREALRVVKELDRDQIDHEQYARIETGHAVLSDQLGNIEDATKSYKLGIESYERLDEYPVTEISDLLNNLAYLYKYQDLTDEAENTFKKALVILEKESNGKETERTALIKNNLGALYQQVEDFDLAEQMFKKALDARKEVLVKAIKKMRLRILMTPLRSMAEW